MEAYLGAVSNGLIDIVEATETSRPLTVKSS